MTKKIYALPESVHLVETTRRYEQINDTMQTQQKGQQLTVTTIHPCSGEDEVTFVRINTTADGFAIDWHDVDKFKAMIERDK